MCIPNKKCTVIGILLILILIIALIIPLVLLKSGKSKDDYNAAGRKELVSIDNVINATENHVNGLIEKATTEKKNRQKRSVDYGIIKNEVRILQKSLQDLDRSISSTSFQSTVGECQKILATVKLVLDNIKQNQFNITSKSYDELSKQESLLKECDKTLETIKTISIDDVEVAQELVNNIDGVMDLSKEIIKETPKPLENTSLVEKPKNYTVSNNETTPSVLINPEINDTNSKNKTNNNKIPAIAITSETDDKKPKNETTKDSSSMVIKPEIQDNKSNNKTNEVTVPSVEAKIPAIAITSETDDKKPKNETNKDSSSVVIRTKTVTGTSKVTIEPQLEIVETTTKPQTKTSKTTTKEIVMTTKTKIEENIKTTLTTTKPIMKTTIGTTSTEDKLKETGDRKAITDEIVKEPEDKVEENKIKEHVSPPVMKQIDDKLEENKIAVTKIANAITKIAIVTKLEKGQTEKEKLEPKFSENDLEKTAEVPSKNSGGDEELKGNIPVGAHSSIV